MVKKPVAIFFAIFITVFCFAFSACARGDYTVTFDADGGELSFTSLKINFGEEITLPEAKKDGYRLACFIFSYGEEDYILTRGEAYNFRDDITVKAVWAPDNAYILRYNLNGGKGVSNPYYYFTEDQTFALNSPYKLGYRFLGWKENGGSEIKNPAVIEKGSSGDKEFSAVFEIAAYTVELNLACKAQNPKKEGEIADVRCTYQGKSKVSLTVSYGDTLKLDDALPIDSDYEFLCWLYYKDGVLTVFNSKGETDPVVFDENNFVYGEVVDIYVYCVPAFSEFE